MKYDGVLNVGTVRSNRVAGCPLKNNKTTKSKGCGDINYIDYTVDTVSNIAVTKWFDNKFIHVTSNYSTGLL